MLVGTNRIRIVLAVCALAALAVIGNAGFPAASAKAQNGGDVRVAFKAAGPISMSNGESALIGLLLPAVQRGDAQPFRLQLIDGSGKPFVEVLLPAVQRSRVAMFEVFFADGSVRVVDKSTNEIVGSGKSDGSLIGLLLPAVRPNGNQLGPIAGSIQLFNADHVRGQVIQMCDGSV